LKVLGIDFEATSTDPKKARIIEVGAILWDGPQFLPEEKFVDYCYAPDYPSLDSAVKRVTGITDEKLVNHGRPPRVVLKALLELMIGADCFISHNVAYDRTLFEAECKRHLLPNTDDITKNTPWVCSLEDIDYPEWIRCKQLSHLALDHGVAIDPSKLHSALGDVEVLGGLLRAGRFKIEDIIAFSKENWVYLKANIPKPWDDGGIGKDAARLAGYSWEIPKGCTEPRFEKQWVKRVKESQIFKEQNRAFKVQVLKP
jgi:DNA polymerase III alpha subunit (gram-positive type)